MDNLWGNFYQLKHLIRLNQKGLDNYSNNSPIGSFLEFDCDYTDELHDFHNDYPLAGEKIKVTEEMLS